MPSIAVFAPAFPSNARLAIILATAKLAGVDVELPAFQPGVDNETEAYAKNCHPCMRFPSAKTEDGYLFEASAIVRYLARVGDKQGAFLYGRTAYEAAQVDQWIDFANGEVLNNAYTIMLHHMGFRPATADELKASMSKVHEAFTGLEAWLETRTFIVGERLTAADVVLGIYVNSVLSLAAEPAFVIELFNKYKSVIRYVNTVFAQPKIVAGLQQMGHDGFAAEKPKEEKKVEAPKPKEEKKKEEKPAAADDEDEEPLMAEGPKKKNPLDALPPSSMVLDAWKREYSNNDTRTKAAPWFFENFDASGYSAYWCKYKYNSDLKMQFMTANLVRGWFQRMEGNRKYAFGVVLIVGEEGNHEIRGFWVFRGQPPLPECVLDVEDTELFDWTHIPDIKAEKEAITDYLCWEGPTIDKPVMEGRTFK